MITSIDQNTKLYGVLGNPVRHSLSPLMHNAAFLESGINAVYLAFESIDIKSAIQSMRALDIKGMSITIPHKSSVIPLLDEVDPQAKDIGAVNTIVNVDSKLTGYNTDAAGALRALEEATPVSGRSCVIVGAGGAARAIGYILKKNNINLIITNRTQKRGKELSKALDSRFIEPEQLKDIDTDILINTTPVGMSPDTDLCPVPEEALKQEMTVMDIIYNPGRTKLLKTARDRGCKIINGLGMFIYQGAEQFKLWTGQEAPVEIMKRVVEEALYNKE
ncbi:shikimate dehydrogenase [Thermodesulfobacteriota bacterium]